MIRIANLFLLFLCIGLGGLAAQDRQREINTDYPILKEGMFANRSYSAAPIVQNPKAPGRRNTFKLVNGVFRPAFNNDGYIKRNGAYLTRVDFADIMGDSSQEAIAFLLPLHSGNAVWYGIYIFSMSKGRPSKILWSFATGDRGVGGLKRIYGRKGRLVVELWGWGSGPDKPPTTHWEAQAGSSWFTRREYSWKNNRFIQKGRARIFKVS